MDRASGSRSRWECIDFELEIREGGPHEYPVAVRSSRGEAQEEMRFPFDEQELKDKLKDLENAVLLSSTSRRRIRSPETQTVQDFGQALFKALLRGEVRAHYDESLREARRQNKGLRLKLRIQPPELAGLPWEFLYDPDQGQYLCLSSKTPLVRYPELPDTIEQLPVTPPLRILGMVASPYDLPRLRVEKEKRWVKEAIRDLETKGRVELTWLDGQTPRDLLRAMRHGPWHVFHFIGHGDFDPDRGEGIIALADEEGNARFLRAEDLAQLLKDHWDLRLVLLNSCEGARSSEHDAFSSTAASLVRPGIPAVLANQYEISDEAAVEFSRAFYEAVADGLPLDAAVAGARTSLKIEIGDTLEWATPVLYMRSPDGRIFDISTSEAPSLEPTQEETREDREEGDLLRRYRECVESVWADGELHRREAEWLSDYANNELGLSPSAAADIERDVMGDTKEALLERQTKDREEEERRNRLDEFRDREWWSRQWVSDFISDTKEAIRERQERAAKEKYRKAVAEAWTDGKLSKAEAESLDALANERGLSTDTAADIEREIMGDTIQAILERQAREEEERRNRLDELYAQAWRSHRAQEWQAVVDVFEQIHALDPEYPDPEQLLVSAREALVALEVAQRVAAIYDQGLRYMDAAEWEQALQCFEEIQRLEPGYRQTETLLSRVRYELADRAEQERPDFLPGEQESKLDRPPDLPGW